MAEELDVTFAELGLAPEVLRALDEVGYEVPTPIQARTIPPMLAGRDVLGQAQTGTGKTAAFALPLLSRIDLKKTAPQALVLTPTRELALQVAEAMQAYGTHLRGFHVLPIYGGTGFEGQLRGLRRGVHVVVGTPGRVMDHMRRGSLTLDGLDTLVLDEADEMLRMGFAEDVAWILEHTPGDRRIALFSATMPPAIARIAATYLRDPVEVRIEQQTATADTVRQRFRVVPHHHKIDVLTRVFEAEDFDGMLVFVRTKIGANELADKLLARGVAAAALNGDVPQARREQIVEQLKSGRIDVLVATDVAARGLDVERLSHVVNFDPPYDAESYVHRIGRTGRAGRKGDAILFLTPRERHLVRTIERATGQAMEPLLLPTTAEVNQRRLERYRNRVAAAIGSHEAELYRGIVDELVGEGFDPVEIAAAVAAVGHEDEPLLLEGTPQWETEAFDRRDRPSKGRDSGPRGRDRFDGDARGERGRGGRGDGRPDRGGERGRGPDAGPIVAAPGMELFRVEVGYADGVQPGNIVGAVCGETGLDRRGVGKIEIRDDHTIVELPEGMPAEAHKRLTHAWVRGRQLQISRVGDGPERGPVAAEPPRPKKAPHAGEQRTRPPRPDRKHAPKSGPGELAETRGPTGPAGAVRPGGTKRPDRRTEPAGKPDRLTESATSSPSAAGEGSPATRATPPKKSGPPKKSANKPGAKKPGAKKPGAKKPGAKKPGAKKPGAPKKAGGIKKSGAPKKATTGKAGAPKKAGGSGKAGGPSGPGAEAPAGGKKQP